MNKQEAMQLVLDRFPSAYLVSTCGHISRDLYNLRDRPENLYMVGSMGMAAPVALGIALVQPEKQVVILDGDGSFLMNLGITAMIGQQRPQNLIHVILDNGMHESTGGQKSVPLVNVAEMARQIGYRSAVEVTGRDDWEQGIPSRGPVLIHMRVSPRTNKIGKRVEWTPQQIVSRFRTSLQQGEV